MILKITCMGYDRNLNHNVENNHKGERGGGHMICLKTHCLLIIFFENETLLLADHFVKINSRIFNLPGKFSVNFWID